MFTKSKTALAAALVIGAVSAASAQSSSGTQGENLRNPGAPVPLYARSARQPAALAEGRNVGIRAVPRRAPGQNAVDDRHAYDANSY